MLPLISAGNPFGGGGVQSQANVGSAPIANPFMGQGNFGGQVPGAPGGFGQFGGQPGASSGFGQFNTPTPSTQGAQFSMQNGGFGGMPQQSQAVPPQQQQQQPPGWGMNAFGAGGFGANMQYNKMVQQPGGFGVPQQQGFAAWPAQQPAMGNPFMVSMFTFIQIYTS